MWLFNAISKWSSANYEKRITKMRSRGTCPDCRGRGFNPLAINEFLVTTDYYCYGCKGSGLFSDWAETRQP